MHSKKYYIVYGLFFSLIVAAVLCLCLTIMQGVPHIDPVFWLMSFAVAFVTSFVVTAVIPLARIAAACAVYFDAQPGIGGVPSHPERVLQHAHHVFA